MLAKCFRVAAISTLCLIVGCSKTNLRGKGRVGDAVDGTGVTYVAYPDGIGLVVWKDFASPC
jgi:hypothetical protein